jgi:hypothetical protein
MNTSARSRSIPPPAPEDLSARASAVTRAIAAAACAPGRFCPDNVAVPFSSPYNPTFARRSASSRRRSAASGSTAITARRSAARSCARVFVLAPGRTFASAAAAARSSSTPVASAISRARDKSITPERNAAPVPVSRPASVIASWVQHDAPYCDIRSASATSAAASSGTAPGIPPGPAGTLESLTAARAATSATISSSAACAQEARRRHAAAAPGSE